jgi:DNA repair photolyase
VRWDQLLITPPTGDSAAEGERQTTPLPLALPGATVRTFDTPEFAGTTFYEVRAKSIINRVPVTSRMGFDWTVNPYRGCTHACSYCLAGDTLILLADGRTKPLQDIVVGDAILGTVRSGTYRRYVPTRVLDHWRTVRPAHRLRLADGTTLVASADHRFLTERGWKYVTGRQQGAQRRPFLTTGNKLMGTGGFAEAPKDTADYRRGYLCGLLRGSTGHQRSGIGDAAVRARARRYLLGFGNTGTATTELTAVPERPTDCWHTGFLAGMFDAAGRCSQGILRIGAHDPELIARLDDTLRARGFDPGRDVDRRDNGLGYVRLRGGLRERLRFFHSVDPAAVDRRDVVGHAVKSDADLRIVAIEPLRVTIPMYDLTTGTGDFVASGVISHNCFARNTHTYLDLDAGLDFDSRIVVKVNAPTLVRRELAAPRWTGASVAMGTNVDCYQRAEGRYRLMPGIIAALRDAANPFSILTKGTLILRDLPLLRQAAEVTEVGLAMSVGSVDETLWRSVEAGAPSPRRRLDAVRRLVDAGLPVGVLMAPVLPGLSDTDEQIDATVRAIAAAGARSITPLALHLRPGAREWFLAWLAREHPRLLPSYRERYRRGAYLDAAYQQELAARVRQAAHRHGLAPRDSAPARRPDPAPTPNRAVTHPVHTQLSLL